MKKNKKIKKWEVRKERVHQSTSFHRSLTKVNVYKFTSSAYDAFIVSCSVEDYTQALCIDNAFLGYLCAFVVRRCA